ncbi:MAG TPA: helix-turn-helix domain-containing protein [Polyangiales bacterium]
MSSTRSSAKRNRQLQVVDADAPRRAPGILDPLAERILDAAYEQFCLVGIRRTSMDDIARRANVGRVTIYRKFESQEKLVEALLNRETLKAIAIVEAAVARVEAAEERLVEGFVAGLRTIVRHPLILSLITTEPERTLPMMTTGATRGLTMARVSMAREIRRAHARVGVQGGCADQTAEILARLTHSLLLTPSSCLPLEDEEACREFARRHIVPMVMGTSAPRR